MRALVITVSGVIGCGAADLCDELGRCIDRSVVLHIRDYAVAGQPGSLWMKGTDNFDALDFSDMKADVDRLAEDRRYDCIIIDNPVGRSSVSALEFTNFVFYLECPLDMALARWVGQKARVMTPENMRKSMRLYMDLWYGIARKIDSIVRHECDVFIYYDDFLKMEETLRDYVQMIMINFNALLSLSEVNGILNMRPFARNKKIKKW